MAFLTFSVLGCLFLGMSSRLALNFLLAVPLPLWKSSVFEIFLLSLVSRWRYCPEGWVGITIARRRQSSQRVPSTSQRPGCGNCFRSCKRYGTVCRKLRIVISKISASGTPPTESQNRHSHSTPTKCTVHARPKSTPMLRTTDVHAFSKCFSLWPQYSTSEGKAHSFNCS